MTWEYRWLQVQPAWDMSEQAPTVPFHLEEAGREGWEAIGFAPSSVERVSGYHPERPVFVILLKRPKG
jgi:hypothetical protein